MNRVRITLAALVAVMALVAVGARAQTPATPSQTRSGLPTDAELRLKQAIQSSFRVLPIQNGLILVPLSRRTGVDNVELREGMIAINGTVVTGGELRQRLGRDGDTVLELSYLDPAAQRRLLLGGAATPSGTPAAPPPAGTTPPEPSAIPESPELPAPPSSSVEEHREFRRVSQGRVRIGGSITVGEDEEVNGAVVAVGGSVNVNGRVRDAVVAVGGTVRLGPKAEINGDVTSVGGGVERDPAAVVHGQVNEIELRWPDIRVRPGVPWHVEPWWGGGPWRTVRLMGTLVRMGLFAVLAALVLLLAPRAVERVDMTVRSEPWKAALVGFFAQLIFVPLLVLTVVFLVVSIIGIPLLVLVPFAVLAFFVALLLGFTGTASALSHGARDRFNWTTSGTFARLLVGLLAIWALTVVGRAISLPGGPFALAGGLFLLVGFLVEYAAWTVGLGGAILTRFGRFGPLYPPPIPSAPVSSAPFEPEPGPAEPPLS